MKLHVFLRNAGIASRRKAEAIIAEGRVLVDGKVAHIGQQVTGTEEIVLDGQVLKLTQREYVYFLVNKPVGYTSTTEDAHAEKTVLDLIPQEVKQGHKLQIAGRLDKSSEGLMLLTDDGSLVYKLTHPKFGVRKIYEVVINSDLRAEEIVQLTQGVHVDTEIYRFTAMQKVKTNTYQVILTEGKKREIREALYALGKKVLRLIRTQLGPFQLTELGDNRYIELTARRVHEFLETTR